MGLLLLAGIAASAIIFAVDRFITLSCISNPVGGDLIGTTRWTGVSVRSLLDEWGVRPNATHLRIRSADDYDEPPADRRGTAAPERRERTPSTIDRGRLNLGRPDPYVSSCD